MKKLFLFLLILPSIVFTQNVKPVIQHDDMIWVGYYNTINIKKRWVVNYDLQLRTRGWYKYWSQALIRTGIGYNINEKVTITAGLAHFRYFISNTNTRGEWRPWQELAVHDKLQNVKITHRLRLEERFNQLVKANDPIDDYIFTYRIRYKLDLKFPLTKNEEGKNLVLLVGDELMINAGKNIIYNYFDQNRSYAGLNLELNKKVTLQLQYMHIWQQLSSGNTFLSTEAIRFNFFHTISL